MRKVRPQVSNSRHNDRTAQHLVVSFDTRKTRPQVSNSRHNDRTANLPKSRKYSLGSYLSAILTAITDPKDGKALLIKCDPAYIIEPEYTVRKEVTDTTYKVRFSS